MNLLRLLSFIIFLSATLLVGCGKQLELDSKWRDREITIDGIDTEWQDATIYVEEAKAAIGLFNDESYMYIRLTSRDRKIQTQVIGLGFTVWFDPNGGKNKTFGIRFPLGMQGMGMPVMARGDKGDSEKFEEMFAELQKEMEILCPGKDDSIRMSVTVAETQGINAKVGNSTGYLVYELKVPLTQNAQHPYAIGTDTSKSISIGFETPELDMGMMRKRMGEGMRPHGGIPGSKRPPGGRGRRPERFQLWATVKLASVPK